MTLISAAVGTKQNLLTASSALSVASITTTALSTTSGGLRVSGGGGRDGTGSILRVVSSGDSVYNPASIFFGASNTDLHVHEFSHLGFAHWHRFNAATAWGQSYGINTNNGYVTFYKGYGASSDQSLKGDAQDASTEDCLDMLRAVSAKTYRRLDLPEGDGERLGFIAQDVEAACPTAWSNLVGTTQYKWAGNGEGGDIRTLDYARLVCPLWQACRSMLARIETLEARVTQLSAPQ